MALNPLDPSQYASAPETEYQGSFGGKAANAYARLNPNPANMNLMMGGWNAVGGATNPNPSNMQATQPLDRAPIGGYPFRPADLLGGSTYYPSATPTAPAGWTRGNDYGSPSPFGTPYVNSGGSVVGYLGDKGFTDPSGNPVQSGANTSATTRTGAPMIKPAPSGTNWGGQPTTTLPAYSMQNQQQGVAGYAQPYVGSMLGATMGQLFNTDQSGNITGMKGYTPYSYNPADYQAAFTPLQQQAQSGIASLQNPWQSQAASGSLMDSINRAQNMQYLPQYSGYQSVQAPQLSQYQMQQPQNVSASTVTAPSLQNLSMQAAPDVQAQQVGTPTMQAAQTSYNPNIQTFQMGPAQQVGTQDFNAPGTAASYMNPYMQNVVDVQQQQARRQAAISGQGQQAQAAQTGGLGGARDIIQRAQANADLQRNLGNIQAQGLQQAYTQGQQQFNTQQQAALQAALANQQAGLTTGQQNLAAQQAAQQLGVQTGLQTNLQNLSNQQQAAVQNQAAQLQAQGLNAQQALQAALANQQNRQQANLQNLSAGLQTQGLQAQTGMQSQQLNQSAALQAALANQQAGLTTGQQNLAAQLGIQSLGAGQNLQAQQLNQAAQQAANQLNAQQQQFGANLGLQGLQAAMSGAGQLGNLGTSGLQNQLNILNAQQQAGATQQAQQQNIINQAVQNYQTAQQYPYMQLGFMQNMLSGLPIQTTANQTYQQPPSTISQLAGVGTSLLGFNKLTDGGVTDALKSGWNWLSGGKEGGSTQDIEKRGPAGLAELAISKM